MDKEVRATEDKVKEVRCNRGTEDRCNTEGRCSKEVPATEDKAKEVLCNRATEDRCNMEGLCNKVRFLKVGQIKAAIVKNIETTSRAKIRFNF